MRAEDFDYHLPEGLIAAYPLERRDGSRLLVLPRAGGETQHRRFSDLPEFLRAGDCLIVNDSAVFPARLRGRRASGGEAEALLLSPEGAGAWRALVRPGRKLAEGSFITLPAGARLLIEADLGGGERRVRIECEGEERAYLEAHGEVPLPPYILAARKGAAAEAAGAPEGFADRERYQTIYARDSGSVAAPTAGLHFTPELMAAIKARGVEVRGVTLHVGAGTFAPVKSEEVSEHVMHEESYSIAPEAADAIEAARRDPARRIIAIGTTVTRVLETCMIEAGRIEARRGSTRLFILPGHEFRAVDALVTNFHLPRSTLLMLVAAFAGRERVMGAYAEAVREGYRFYSYGDAMLIH